METSPLQVASLGFEQTCNLMLFHLFSISGLARRTTPFISSCIGQVRTTSGHFTRINVELLLSKYYITAYETEMITCPITDPVPARILVKYKTTVLSMARPPILIKNTIKAEWKR